MSTTNSCLSLKNYLFPAWAPSLGDNKCSPLLQDSEAQRKALGRIRHQMSLVLIISPPPTATASERRLGLEFLGMGRKRQNGNAKIMISNKSRKSLLNPNFVRAGASPNKTGERGKLRVIWGNGKKSKTLRPSFSDLLYFTFLYSNFLLSLIFQS